MKRRIEPRLSGNLNLSGNGFRQVTGDDPYIRHHVIYVESRQGATKHIYAYTCRADVTFSAVSYSYRHFLKVYNSAQQLLDV